MIYAVAYPKGGVGKSTTAAHLGVNLARKSPTLLIDGDPQASLATWATWRRDHKEAIMPTTVRLLGNAIFDEGKELTKNYEHTVIDVGGRDGTSLRNALLLADRVIVPMGNSGFDVAGIQEFKEMFAQAQAFNRTAQFRVLLNRMRGSTEEVQAFIADHNVEVFKTMIGERRVYAKSVSEGLTVMEYKPREAAATYEMSKLFEEIDAWA